MLRKTGISYVVSGESEINLAEAVGLLGEHFGISRLYSKAAAISTAPSLKLAWWTRSAF